MPSTDDLWSMYGHQILKFAAPDFDPTKQQFSMASSTLSLDLGNPDPAVVNGYIYNLGNTIPAPSPCYAPGSGLFTAYQRFLDAIDLHGDTNPNLDSQINIAAANMNAAQTNFQNVQGQAIAAWTAYKAVVPGISFSDYVTQQYLTYGQAKNALDATTSAWQQLMTQKYGQGYEIIANARNRLSPTGGAADILSANSYNMAVKTGSAAPAGSAPVLPGSTPPPAPSALIPSYDPAFALQSFTSVYQQWQANSASKAPPAASVVMNGSSAAQGFENMGWSSESAGLFSYGFFDVWGETSSSQDTQTSFAMDSSFSMTIDFVGLNTFTIAPGGWFDLGLVQSFRNQLLPGSPDLFSPAGALARIPYQAVIGFQPKITLSMSKENFSTFASQFQSQTTAGFGFGPFVVGETHSSTYADKSSASFDAESATVTIAPPPSTVPVLLGVISTRLDDQA